MLSGTVLYVGYWVSVVVMLFKSVSSAVYFSSCLFCQLLEGVIELPGCGFCASLLWLYPFLSRISRHSCLGRGD